MRASHILFLSGLFLVWYNAKAQDLTSLQQRRFIAPSPDASAFAKYGNIPVHTYTGIPSIDVPLYSITSRDISIPISLSYHSGGITVEEESGWTGLGWTLNVGGVITRQIRGGNDFASVGDGANANLTYLYKGYPYDSAMSNSLYPQSYVTAVCEKYVDPEPDIFYFNFLGRSGSFVFEKGQSGQYLVGTSLKAEKIDIRYDKNIQQWKITTPDGFIYLFGTREIQETKRTPPLSSIGGHVITETPLDEEVYNDFYFYNREDFYASSWYLQKITSPQGEEVKYIYDVLSDAGSLSQSASKYISVKNTFSDEMNVNVDYTVTGPNTQCWGNLLDQSPFRDRTQTFTAHIYLKEIQFKNGSITFIKSDREDMRTLDSNLYPFTASLNPGDAKVPQKLDALIIKDGQNNSVKKFEFRYSYFNDDYTGPKKWLYKRLKLTGVRECAPQANLCHPYHQFFYEETVKLPSKYSRAQDFWGYYNGADTNRTRVPKGTFMKNPTTYIFVGNANRQPSATHMLAGMLNKIVYPTGGSTELILEPNDYYDYGSGNFYITDFDNNPFTILQLADLWSDGGTTDIIQTVILTETSHIDLKRTLIFRPADHSFNPCCAPNPFSGVDGYGVSHNYHYTELPTMSKYGRLQMIPW